MDVLPPFLEVLDADGATFTPPRRLERVRRNEWSEGKWDDIIVKNVDLLAGCLVQAGVLDVGSRLKVLGTQLDNVDVVFAEVSAGEGEEFRRLVLLEDKLLRNSEARRQVLAQILDYAQRAQEDWPQSDLRSKFKGHDEWLSRHRSEILRSCRRGDFLLVIAGDGIDDGLERLTRRFRDSDPLNASELALVSMALYEQQEHLLLIPHVVSAVQRSPRELTIQVTVRDTAGRELEADAMLVAEAVSAGGTQPMPVRDEVTSFLREARDRVADLFPGVPPTRQPRKAIEFWTTAPDGAKVQAKIHFGGYNRDKWSPIKVGIVIGAKDTAMRDAWAERFKAHQAALPAGTMISASGPKTLDVLKAVEWSEATELNRALVETLTDDLTVSAQVLQGILKEMSDEAPPPSRGSQGDWSTADEGTEV